MDNVKERRMKGLNRINQRRKVLAGDNRPTSLRLSESLIERFRSAGALYGLPWTMWLRMVGIEAARRLERENGVSFPAEPDEPVEPVEPDAPQMNASKGNTR